MSEHLNLNMANSQHALLPKVLIIGDGTIQNGIPKVRV